MTHSQLVHISHNTPCVSRHCHPSANPQPCPRYCRRNTAKQNEPSVSTMDMMMEPGAPSLTQPGVVRPRATPIDSGSESSGGVALSPTITRNATTSSTKRQPRPPKEARIALRNERLAAAAAADVSAGAGSEPPPVVATNPTANSSARNSRPSKKARKALRKKQAAAFASAGAQHKPAPTMTEAATNGSTQNPRLSKKARKALREKNAAADAVASAHYEPTPVVTACPTMTEQAATNGSTRSFRLSKRGRRALRKREAADADRPPPPPPDAHPADIRPVNFPADATDEAGNKPSNDVTENLTTITEAELNGLRAIEARYNALEARFDERPAQQMVWTEGKLRKHRFIFVIIFLMIFTVFSLHFEAEERRRKGWW
jgi:hypothetical protein